MHLVIIDMQEKLLPHVADSDSVLLNTFKLAKAFKILNLPVTATRQIKLGETVSPLREILDNVYEKTTFSCMGCEEFVRKIMGDKKFVLAGIETHICVLQTALDMLKYGFEVHVAVDATSSRKEVDRETAIRRMIQEGVKVTTAEAVIYDILKDAKHEKFKEILEIIKMQRVSESD